MSGGFELAVESKLGKKLLELDMPEETCAVMNKTCLDKMEAEES